MQKYGSLFLLLENFTNRTKGKVSLECNSTLGTRTTIITIVGFASAKHGLSVKMENPLTSWLGPFYPDSLPLYLVSEKCGMNIGHCALTCREAFVKFNLFPRSIFLYPFDFEASIDFVGIVHVGLKLIRLIWIQIYELIMLITYPGLPP